VIKQIGETKPRTASIPTVLKVRRVCVVLSASLYACERSAKYRMYSTQQTWRPQVGGRRPVLVGDEYRERLGVVVETGQAQSHLASIRCGHRGPHDVPIAMNPDDPLPQTLPGDRNFGVQKLVQEYRLQAHPST
jgi:hypothetical protein